MVRRRARRTRSRTGRRRPNVEQGFPRFEHNQWTVEGEIERLGAFARGARHSRGARRWFAIGLVLLIIVVPIVVGIVLGIAQLVSQL
jgi:hypothetical protein